MNIEPLIETESFSQHKIVLGQGEQVEQGQFELWQTFYVMAGVGVIKTPTHVHNVRCGNFIFLNPNIPYTITNTGPSLLSVLLTQAR